MPGDSHQLLGNPANDLKSNEFMAPVQFKNPGHGCNALLISQLGH